MGITKIYPTFDQAGRANYQLVSQPKDCGSTQQCIVYPEKVIPVIFVPGVMGSNLKSNQNDEYESVWNLDSTWSILSSWITAGPQKRKEKLNPVSTEVDDGGKVDDKDELFLLQTRRERGWGSVAYTSYSSFLNWLQDTLNDFDNMEHGERIRLLKSQLDVEAGDVSVQPAEVALTYGYIFPVFAVGYNWLQSNADSAQYLADKITDIINFYQSKNRQCEKVILVTHSMGGLVARHYTQVLEGEQHVLGVLHGVLPALGAAAAYRRMKAGTEYASWSLTGWLTSKVLGGDTAAMTAVLAQSAGPLQLLPGKEYGNYWLRILDGQHVTAYPTADPYEEIYLQRDKWWGLCEDQFINPGKNGDQQQRDNDWQSFSEIIDDQVSSFIENLAGKYHSTTYAFYGATAAHLAYGEVCWQAQTSWFNFGKSQEQHLTPGDALALDKTENGTTRGVTTPSEAGKWVKQTYEIQAPEEPGDGTVPLRSGRIADHFLQARYQVEVDHESAYQNSDAQQFTLRALVKIIQQVQHTTLADL
ncbi:lipase/acyltransferase domain-containing protein [Rouxiella sp. Mn2063]|uniref:PGAP1-like alpha/beta domain-containing protein n=1 Tax=Rouxiella sp. Mn2063 TaxID=3395262 RepID=UPI003BE6F5F2